MYDLTDKEVEYIRNCIELEFELWDGDVFENTSDEEEQELFFNNLLDKLNKEVI